MVELRRNRPSLDLGQSWYVRYDQVRGRTFAQLWFSTNGCSWDRRGECVMCNYGHHTKVDWMEMVAFVQDGLGSIDRPVYELYVSPSGSLLDEREVPVRARHSILQLVNDFPAERFSFETRPETVTASTISELRNLVPSKRIAIGFGLESTDPWILRNCINKPNTNDTFTTAITHMSGIDLYANVSLGSAFLSPVEAVDDAVHSVNWALIHGADLALVFPMHVKGYTLLNWLHDRGLYEPPSLWSLVEVLTRLDPALVKRVIISWYRADYGVDSGVIASPTTCPNCKEAVLVALDKFREEPSIESVGRLMAIGCACRQIWMGKFEIPVQPLAERVFNIYHLLAGDLGLTEWLKERESALITEMTRAEP